MNLYPSPADLAAVVCFAAVAIIVICEECWRATHHDHRKGPR